TAFDLAFEHVTFSYDGKKNAVEDVTFRVPAGSVVGLVGPSGGRGGDGRRGLRPLGRCGGRRCALVCGARACPRAPSRRQRFVELPLGA
ncbi:hypothetical protein C1867_05220, partial [Eggerthella lenta]